MLKQRSTPADESRYSWTADFAARRAKAREEMQSLLAEAAEIKAAVVDQKERIKQLKKEKADPKKLDRLNAQIREKEKAARDLETRAADIDAAVFDLKAVNPHAVAKLDTRSPQEILRSIEHHGRVVSEALARLGAMLFATVDR